MRPWPRTVAGDLEDNLRRYTHQALDEVVDPLATRFAEAALASPRPARSSPVPPMRSSPRTPPSPPCPPAAGCPTAAPSPAGRRLPASRRLPPPRAQPWSGPYQLRRHGPAGRSCPHHRACLPDPVAPRAAVPQASDAPDPSRPPAPPSTVPWMPARSRALALGATPSLAGHRATAFGVALTAPGSRLTWPPTGARTTQDPVDGIDPPTAPGWPDVLQAPPTTGPTPPTPPGIAHPRGEARPRGDLPPLLAGRPPGGAPSPAASRTALGRRPAARPDCPPHRRCTGATRAHPATGRFPRRRCRHTRAPSGDRPPPARRGHPSAPCDRSTPRGRLRPLPPPLRRRDLRCPAPPSGPAAPGGSGTRGTARRRGPHAPLGHRAHDHGTHDHGSHEHGAHPRRGPCGRPRPAAGGVG